MDFPPGGLSGHRGPYQYRARIRLQGASLTETFESRTAALAWATEREAEILQDPVAFSSKHEHLQHAKTVTVADVLSRYRDEVTPTKKGAASEHARIEAMLRTPFAQVSLAELIPVSINDYIATRRSKHINGKPLSGSTINRDLNLISHALNVARKRWSWPATNPIPDIERPKSSSHRTRRLVDDEEERLLAACEQARNPWLPVLVIVAMETAMRRGEPLQITWKDVDLTRQVIHIADSKTGKGRTVPLTQRATATLSTWQEASGTKADTRVFTGVTANALKLSYTRATRRADIDNLTFHDLRHEATSRFFGKHGLDLHEVMAATGHSHAAMRY